MVTTNVDLRFRPLDRDMLSAAHAREELARIARALIFDGMVPGELPWGNREFQRMLIDGIAQLRKYKADAEKLAIVKEVFGGGK